MHRRAVAGNTAAESVPLDTVSDVAVDASAADDPPVKFAPESIRCEVTVAWLRP